LFVSIPNAVVHSCQCRRSSHASCSPCSSSRWGPWSTSPRSSA
jgi:hypothetical protein